jgi:ankyrin repeat protein
VNLASNDISTPLAEAIIYGHDAIAGMLILAGADVGKEHGLFIALAELYKQVNIVKLLKQFGA